MMRFLSSACLAVSLAASAGACAPTATEPAAVVVNAPTIKLPVSINAIMVALVDHASEPLWVDAYVPPTTEERWKEAEYNAYQVAVGGKLIMLEGTGPNDPVWTSDPAWRTMADEMSAAGMEALSATQVRNIASLNAAGDRLVAACEACHKKFKPDLPTMGLYKSPNYPPKTE